MVAVRVTDEDVLHLTVVEFVFDELSLRAFAAVNHVQRPLTAHNLRGGVMTERRLGAPATEDGDFERKHGGNGYGLWVIEADGLLFRVYSLGVSG